MNPRPARREQLQERVRLLASQQDVEVGAEDRLLDDEDDLRDLLRRDAEGPGR